jgi:hypothetical protein
VLIQHLAGMQAKEGVHTLDLKHSMSDTTPAELIPLVKFGFEGIIAKRKAPVMSRPSAVPR